jgi:hypothetical protein
MNAIKTIAAASAALAITTGACFAQASGTTSGQSSSNPAAGSETTKSSPATTDPWTGMNLDMTRMGGPAADRMAYYRSLPEAQRNTVHSKCQAISADKAHFSATDVSFCTDVMGSR